MKKIYCQTGYEDTALFETTIKWLPQQYAFSFAERFGSEKLDFSLNRGLTVDYLHLNDLDFFLWSSQATEIKVIFWFCLTGGGLCCFRQHPSPISKK